MPIKGLTDRHAAFPEIGQIRKGGPKEPNKPGPDLDYFRVEFDERETEARAAFEAAYGPAPRELNILLPFNSVDENFEAWREAYVAGAMIHRCDGERILYEIDPGNGRRLIVNGEPYKSCDGSLPVGTLVSRSGERKDIFCRPSGRLKVLIPELHRLAFLTALTTSIHDILNLSRQLDALQAINRGRIIGVPLILKRRELEISTPGQDGKRVRRKKWLLSIEADPTWVAAKLSELKLDALPGKTPLAGELPALDAPRDEPDEPEPPGAGDTASEAVGAFQPRQGPILDASAARTPDPAPQERAAAQATAQADVKGTPRPYEPSLLKQRLAQRAAYHANRPGLTITQADRQRLAAALSNCFDGTTAAKEGQRHSFTWWAAGHPSVKQLPSGWVQAMLDWLQPGEAFRPAPIAETEARRAMATDVAAFVGQHPLPFPAPKTGGMVQAAQELGGSVTGVGAIDGDQAATSDDDEVPF